METRIDTSPRISPAELPQEVVDKEFIEMTAPLVIAKQLSEFSQAAKNRHDLTTIEQEAIRDEILGELLEIEPHEAIAKVVESLAKLYARRTIEYQEGDKMIKSFATRDVTNERLDDHFQITTYDDGRVDIRCSSMPFADMGYEVLSQANGKVSTYTKTGTYKLETSREGMHEERIREFLVRSLETAGIALKRQKEDPVEAELAHQQAKQMHHDELFPEQ